MPNAYTRVPTTLFKYNTIQQFRFNSNEKTTLPTARPSRPPIIKKQSFEAIRRSLAELAVQRAKEMEVAESTANSSVAERFRSETKFKLQERTDTQQPLVLAFTDARHTVEVKFFPETAWDRNLGEEEESPYDEGVEEDDDVVAAKEEEDDDDPALDDTEDLKRMNQQIDNGWPTELDLEIVVKNLDKSGVSAANWSLRAYTEAENRLFVTSIMLGDKEDVYFNFEDFSQEMQDKIYDYIEELGIEDRLAYLIKQICVDWKQKQDVKFLNEFSKLLNKANEVSPTPPPPTRPPIPSGKPAGPPQGSPKPAGQAPQKPAPGQRTAPPPPSSKPKPPNKQDE